MRRILVDSIKGNEKLARDIINDFGIVIMSGGINLKREYIKKLKELDIEYIFVEDEYSKGVQEQSMTELLIQDQCQDVLKDIIDKYSYQKNGELEEIKIIAEEIIRDILKDQKVMFSISGIRKKSESTYSHSINVCALSVFIGLRMNIPKDKVKEIAVGSLLHDIGYASLPYDYLNLKFDECNIEDQRKLMKHVINGYTLVADEDWISQSSKDIILNHHERVDGLGYPFHKKGDKIKIGTKIVAVCNEFDRKVYGYMENKMKVNKTIEYILSQAGIKFDPEVVACFINSVAAYPNGSGIITTEGETGIVLRQNYKDPKRPVVHMITDKHGSKYTYWKEMDLSKELKISIWDTTEI
jgi:HD-GYP domain-containing protein (c-di-GMP phosphodiesterase class II)